MNTGNVFIADTRNERIRKVTPNGIITTVAGNGGASGAGDGGPAVEAQLMEPGGVAVDAAGNLFIAETGGHRIRMVNANGIINTIAGSRTMGFAGDGGPAASSQLAFPAAVAVDGDGNLFIADSANNRVRLVTPNGLIQTIAGTGDEGSSGDGGPATAARIGDPQAITVADGNLFIADTNNQRIRKVTPDGIISTVAGTGVYGFSGDGGDALAAQITSPYGVAVDGVNTIFISDTFSNRVRRVVSPVVSFEVTDRGGTSLSTAGTSSSTRTGYARIESSGGISAPAGMAIFSYRPGGYLVSETAVPAAPPLNSGRIYAEIDGPLNTGVAIANPNDQMASVTFYFTDGSGNDISPGTVTIGANQQIAGFLNSEPFHAFENAQFQGTFSFSSDVPVGAIAIRGLVNEQGDFLMSALPVVDTTTPAASGTVVVPHFAHGGGWATEIILVNPGDATLGGTLEFRDENGAVTDTLAYAVPSRSAQKLSPGAGGAAVVTGSVRIVPADGGTAPVPLADFAYRPGGAVTVTQAGVSSTMGTAFRIYAESSGAGNSLETIQTAIAIANNASAPANVVMEVTNLDGSSAGLPQPASQTLPPFGHVAKFLSEVLPGLPSPFKGILRVSTDSPQLSINGLRTAYNARGDFLMTATPPTSETAVSASGKLVVPHLPDGGGFTTELILYSSSPGQSSTGSISVHEQSGQPFDVTLK
jgi:sugar lactone lactonase YvrE